MELQLRSWYSRQSLSHAINIFRFPEDYSHVPYAKTSALRYLFQYRTRGNDTPKFSELCNKSFEFFEDCIREGNIVSAREIADIIGEFAHGHRTRFLDRLREMDIEEEEYNYEPARKPIKKTVYDDSQNVHNTIINRKVLRVSKNLHNMFKDILEPDHLQNEEEIGKHKDTLLEHIQVEFSNRQNYHYDLIKKSFSHIKKSVGTFGINTSLQDVLLAVYLFIQKHKDRKGLEERLLEELQEMKGQCSTGHLARLVNVIQGFTEDENLIVKIGNTEQYNAVIRQYLSKVLQECQDNDVLDGMIKGTDSFKIYIQQSIRHILLSWIDEYGKEIINHIPMVVNDYTKVKVFVS